MDLPGRPVLYQDASATVTPTETRVMEATWVGVYQEVCYCVGSGVSAVTRVFGAGLVVVSTVSAACIGGRGERFELTERWRHLQL